MDKNRNIYIFVVCFSFSFTKTFGFIHNFGDLSPEIMDEPTFENFRLQL